MTEMMQSSTSSWKIITKKFSSSQSKSDHQLVKKETEINGKKFFNFKSKMNFKNYHHKSYAFIYMDGMK